MIDQTLQKRSTEVDQYHYFVDGIFESLPFSDEIMNAPHNNEFKQYDLPKYVNANGDFVGYPIEFKSKLMLHVRNGELKRKLFPMTMQKEGFTWFTELKPKLSLPRSSYKSGSLSDSERTNKKVGYNYSFSNTTEQG